MCCCANAVMTLLYHVVEITMLHPTGMFAERRKRKVTLVTLLIITRSTSVLCLSCFTWAQWKTTTSCDCLHICSTKKCFSFNVLIPLWCLIHCGLFTSVAEQGSQGNFEAVFICFFLLYQGPQRRGKECSNTSGGSNSGTQQTSNDSFDEGGASPESQRGSSSKFWIQAPAVSSHTWIIRRLRKSNPLCTHWKVKLIVILLEVCVNQTWFTSLSCNLDESCFTWRGRAFWDILKK